MDPFPAWSQRLRASDSTACTEVFEAMHPVLLRYALQLTRDEATAYDVVQEAFIKLWHVRETLDPKRSMKALLYRIVRNLSLNVLRMKRHQTIEQAALPDLEMAQATTPEEAFDTEVLGVHLRRWIDAIDSSVASPAAITRSSACPPTRAREPAACASPASTGGGVSLRANSSKASASRVSLRCVVEPSSLNAPPRIARKTVLPSASSRAIIAPSPGLSSWAAGVR